MGNPLFPFSEKEKKVMRKSDFVEPVWPESVLEKICQRIWIKGKGPVVQSIVSLTKWLVNDSLSLLVRLKSSVLIFFAEKMWVLIFSAKNGSISMYNMFEILMSR